MPPRLYADQTTFQLRIRLIALIIITFEYCVVISLLTVYSDNNIYHQQLTAFECIGPCILWSVLSVTVSLWFGINCDINLDIDYNYKDSNSSILANRYLHLLQNDKHKTTSILGFLVALQAYLGTSQKTMTLQNKYDKMISALLFFSSLIYALIPTVLRVYYDNFLHFISVFTQHPSIAVYWIVSFLTNFCLSLILIRISYKITIDTFRWLLIWVSSILFILNVKKSKKKKLAYLSFDKIDNIVNWIEMRGYIHYLSLLQVANVEIWMILYVFMAMISVCVSIIYGINLQFGFDKYNENDIIDHNCIFFGSIFFAIVALLHMLTVLWLGSKFHSLHISQIKQCRKQFFLLNIKISKCDIDSKNQSNIEAINNNVDSCTKKKI